MDKVYACLPLIKTTDIRVLDIFPTNPGQPIETRLRVVSLDDNDCHYQALSYTWGDPTYKVVIRCDGTEFLATKNMHSALERLPRIDKSQSLGRTFWIDAICINQEDWNERGSQVQLMLRIYQQADVVWADLGDASAEEFLGVAKFINLMIEVLDVNHGGPKLERNLEELLPRQDDPIWVIWQKFLSRPYFTRLWTVCSKLITLLSDALNSLARMIGSRIRVR